MPIICWKTCPPNIFLFCEKVNQITTNSHAEIQIYEGWFCFVRKWNRWWLIFKDYIKVLSFNFLIPILLLKQIIIYSLSKKKACFSYNPLLKSFNIIFSSPGHRPCELLPSLGICPSVRLSVVCRKLSHLNLLLWNPWTELNQTWQGWSLGGSLSKLCPTVPPSIQDDCCYWKYKFLQLSIAALV